MSQRKKVLDWLLQSGAMKHGHFLLASGLHTDTYIQCAQLFQHPPLAERIAAEMAQPWRGKPVSVVLVAATGGIIIGHELARQLNARCIFAERSGKLSPLTLQRGFWINPGERVLIAEDVVTTGGTVNELLALCEKLQARVIGVAAVVHRGNDKNPFGGIRYEPLLRMQFPCYAPEECPLCEQGLPLIWHP